MNTRKDYNVELNNGQAKIKGMIKKFNGSNRVPGQFSSIEFLVDTGSNRTTISIKDLIRVGYSIDYLESISEFDKTFTELPTGKVQYKHITIPYLMIHERRMENVIITIISPKDFIAHSENDFNNNLLGTDILSLFNFTFNNEYNTFELSQNLRAPKSTATIKSIKFLEKGF